MYGPAKEESSGSRKTEQAAFSKKTCARPKKKCSNDFIYACVKRDPLSSACMIQAVVGVCGRSQVKQDILQRVEDHPNTLREFSHAPLDCLASATGQKISPLPCTESASLGYLLIMRHVSSLHIGFLQQLAAQPDFSAHLLSTDESPLLVKASLLRTTFMCRDTHSRAYQKCLSWDCG
ncbi:hypothetical protein CEXT_244581 [Caerostris extrusa]|uniref:Uncharacterized protein n=1 Tax=Caerostris extrusa TaxID=172846 RepID=A0AAV4VJB7_CAEEX|nr:hypothetical protein CEXT_244581 [Caerostris extrusa]